MCQAPAILPLTPPSSEASQGTYDGVVPIQWKGNLGPLPRGAEGQGDGEVPAVGVQGEEFLATFLCLSFFTSKMGITLAPTP